MRIDIVENDGRRLHLTLRTNVTLYAAFGVMFIGLGLGCIWLLAVEASIVVEEQRFAYTNTCVWIVDCGTVQAVAQDVLNVALVGHDLQVELPDGAHRLALPQSDGVEKAAIARDIQAALSMPGASYRHAEGDPVAAFLLGLVCIASGLLIGAAIQWVNVLADRDAGTLEVTRRLLLWPTVQKRGLDLSDLDAVLVTPHTLDTFKHVVISYSVRLQTRGRGVGDSVGLTFLPMFTERAAANLAQIIRTWMRGG